MKKKTQKPRLRQKLSKDRTTRTEIQRSLFDETFAEGGFAKIMEPLAAIFGVEVIVTFISKTLVVVQTVPLLASPFGFFVANVD